MSHCNTAAHAARLLALECGASNPENNLKALGLKQLANKAFERGNLSEAEELYTEVYAPPFLQKDTCDTHPTHFT